VTELMQRTAPCRWSDFPPEELPCPGEFQNYIPNPRNHRYTDPETGDKMISLMGILSPIDSPERDVIPTETDVSHVRDLCVCHHSRLQHHSQLGAATGPSHHTLPWTTYMSGGPGSVTHACTGKKRNGDPCRCDHFEPVAAKASKHSYKRGTRTMKKPVAALYPGDRVLAGWTTVPGKVRLNDNKGNGAMVAVVLEAPRKYRPDEEASGQSWRDRAVVVVTDLGETIPQTGGTPVLVVR
jgi:hypothetical protein